MKKILNEYINKMNNGLFILDAPTGFGKTRTVVDYIKESLNSNNADKIFFVTNLKKNLPIEFFDISEYKDICLYLKSNSQNVIDEWENIEISDTKIKNSIEFKNLDNAIILLNKARVLSDKRFINSVEESIERNYEPKFREFIKKCYFYGKTTNEKNTIIRNNGWLIKLYPSIEIRKYKLILLSTKKFISLFDPLSTLPYFIYESDIINNSIIFIDEFDASKNEILDTIIENGLKTRIDIIKLFLHLYHALENNEIPSIIKRLEKSNESENDEYYYSALDVLTKNKMKFKEIYDNYKLNYLFKTKGINEEKSFIFNDGNYISITKSNQKKHLLYKLDEEELVHTVYTAFKNNGEEVQLVIEEIQRAINFFVNGIKWVASDYEYYRNRIDKDNHSESYMTFDESCRSILSIFNLEDKEINYLLEIIRLNKPRRELNKVHDNEDGFLKTGLEIIEIEDSDYHNLQSVFHLFKFKVTPEEILRIIAKNAKVVGISATGSIDTVLANYDLSYLRKNLKDSYYELDNDNFNRIKKNFLETQKVYKKEVKINVDVVDNYESLDSYDICKKIIDEIIIDDKKEYYYNKLKDDNKIYYNSILLKIGYAYKRFIEDDNIKSFICFLNSLPKYNNEKGINNKELQELYKDISEFACNTFNINSFNYDDEMNKVNELLSKKEKCFIITTYQTLGSGKNIQYTIPLGIENNMVIRNKDRMEKDFDGILLIAPTYLMQNLDYMSENKYCDLSKFIFQQEYLHKKYNNSSLFKKNIIAGFKKLFFENSFSTIDYKNCDLYMSNAKIIIQAIGRICRSPNKNKNILIITEKEVVERLEEVRDELEERLLNAEFKALLNVKIKKPSFEISRYNVINISTKKELYSKAKTLRSSFEKKEEWVKLRDLALRNPTYSGNIKELDRYYFKFPIILNRYFYKIKGYTIEDINLNYRDNYNQVSIKEAELESLMSIPCIEKLFNEKNYSKQFKKNNKIMSPAFFKQIYLGALGEVTGKAILENYLDIFLNEIEDYSLYELFDYKIGDVYIDFKNWKSFITDTEEQLKKILRKLNRVKGSKAIIINLVKRGEFKNYIENLPKNIIQIPWVIDFENKIDYKQLEMIRQFIDK